MAFRPLIQHRTTLPAVTTAFAAGSLLLPRTTLYADAPPEQFLSRKPIYDDLPLLRQPSKPTPISSDFLDSNPTPTDRLATQIRHARLFMHAHTAVAEDALNNFMSAFLAHERSFTQTVASLAPPPESREHLMPGGLYVLVAAMAGSIVSRNKNILLRATVPAAVGIGAAWMVLPITTRNVADLAWTFEEKAPVVAINHMRIRGVVEEGWRQTKIRAKATRRWSEEMVKESREVLESWVRKGR